MNKIKYCYYRLRMRIALLFKNYYSAASFRDKAMGKENIIEKPIEWKFPDGYIEAHKKRKDE